MCAVEAGRRRVVDVRDLGPRRALQQSNSSIPEHHRMQPETVLLRDEFIHILDILEFKTLSFNLF